MTDPYIAKCAANARTLARQVLDWSLDDLRLAAGLAEVVEVADLDLSRGRGLDTERDPGVRMMLCPRTCAPYAHFHAIRDKVTA